MTIPGKVRQRLTWTFSTRYMQLDDALFCFRLNNINHCVKPLCFYAHSIYAILVKLQLLFFFLQNHLIVTVPPFHNQSITSLVSVGIFVMTNAGRSHEAQTFTYIPDSGTSSISDKGAIQFKSLTSQNHHISYSVKL